MANPNINTASNVYANNASALPAVTTEVQLISNPAGSGKVFVLDALWAANVSAAQAGVTVTLYRSATNTGTGYKLSSAVNVLANATSCILSKNSGFTLLENQSIYVASTVASALSFNACWKEFS